MMKKLILITTAIFALSFAIIFASCQGEPPAEWTVKKLLYEGKKQLESGQGSRAYNYFKEALQKDPDNIEGHFGIILALDKRVFANIDGIIDLLTGVYIKQPSRDDCEIACARLEECDLLAEAWTTKERCIQDCPFKLQPFMFETMINGDSCFKIRAVGLEWILPTTPENCEALCKDLDRCGLIKPPVTFTVDGCIAHCPTAYVEHHSKCYMSHLGECNGYDRTCFDHTTVGLQILFRKIGIFIPQEIITYTNWMFENMGDEQYYLRTYKWTLVDPPLTLNFAGRYDTGFMYLSRALGYGFHALLGMATAVQLEMDFQTFDMNFNYGNPQGIQQFLAALIRTLETLVFDPIFPNGFVILDEDFAIPQVQQGGQDLGNMLLSIADLVDFMDQDQDRQSGKAVGYDDANFNFKWDEDETVTIGGDGGFELTKAQAFAIRDLTRAIGANLIDRTPFAIAVFKPVLESFGIGNLNWIVDLFISWSLDGTADWSQPFWNPTRWSFRDLLSTLIDKLKIIQKVVIEMGLE
jgi:hypothetical protein